MSACNRVQACVADYVTARARARACVCVCVADNVVPVRQIMPLYACLWGRSNLRSGLCDYMCGRYSLCSRMCDCMHT